MSFDANSEEEGPLAEEGPVPVVIKPFTERQLLGLYRNDLLGQVQGETDTFLQRENGLYFNSSPLKDLLYDYMRSRVALLSSETTLERLKNELDDKEKAIWTLEQAKIENEGVCHDKVKVVSVHKYQIARFNASAVSSCNKTMKELREELFEHHSLCLYKATKLKMRIDDYVKRSCCAVTQNRDQLTTNISVIFSFQRKPINNDICIRDSRMWLDRLVSVLLQTNPTFVDHLFLLNHILRCPGGVGHWAAPYIQIHLSTLAENEDYLSSEALNQMIALLSVLFAPVKGRAEILRDLCHPSTPSKVDGDSPWVSIDSDGEDDEGLLFSEAPLRENDYVALLNQFPFEDLFKYLLKVDSGIETYDPKRFSTSSFFKLFAFGTQFVNLLKSGLQHFSAPSYRQLAKRLGRLIKHTLQCVSDHWLCFFNEHQAHPDEMAIVDRIEVEYNNFFLRAIKSIFRSSANSGMWQYLAVVPYNNVKEDVLWHAYAMFHFIDSSSIEVMRQSPNFCNAVLTMMQGPEFRSSFEDTLSGLPDTDVMFLLTTFANMAIAREDFEHSKLFICAVVTELVGIGFLNELTSDMSSKGCRDLLSNISMKHPQVLSHLLRYFDTEPKLVKDSVINTVISLHGSIQSITIVAFQHIAIYICRDLVFSSWIPTNDDFQLLGSWLTKNKLDSKYSQLSRLIFSKMNWTIDFLHWERHKALALLVVEASIRFAPDSIAGNFLHDSVRQVSNLASKLRRSAEQIFTSWAWEMCSRLKIHRYDQPKMANFTSLDLDLDAEILGEAVATKNPLGCFIALQLCQTGHVIEDFLDRGLQQLAVILSSGHYDHVLECISNVTPIAFDQPDMLWNSEEFIKIMHQVITSDQTYLKMAKDLVVNDFPGPVLKEFVNMLSFQMESCEELYDMKNPRCIVTFWARVIVQIPNWMNTRGTLFVLEHLCKVAAALDLSLMKEAIKDFDQKMLAPSTDGGFLSWFSGSKTSNTSLTSVTWEFPWTSFCILEVEEEREEVVLFWEALIDELTLSSGALDRCQKKVVTDKSFPEYASSINSLPIYKWCQLILDCPLDEPLQAAFAQKFFKYFSVRSTYAGSEDRPRVGRLFFEGMINTHYFGRIVARFNSIEEFYKKEIVEDRECRHAQAFADLFHAFGLWLSDMLILDEKLHLPSLSPNMCPELLGSILKPTKVRSMFV